MSSEELEKTTEHEAAAAKVEQELERSMVAMQTMRRIAVTMTRNNDWTIMGQTADGEPVAYLKGTGAEKIMAAVGLSRKIEDGPEVDWLEDEGGKYYTVRYRVALLNREGMTMIVEDGFCSSRDPFFGSAKGKLKPLEKVDMTMIQRKALNNACVRAVSRLLGLREIPVSQLKKAGIEPTSRVVYGGSKKKAAAPPAAKKKAPAKKEPTRAIDDERPDFSDDEIDFTGGRK